MQKHTSGSRTRVSRQDPDGRLTPRTAANPLLQLQSQIGNTAVAGLLGKGPVQRMDVDDEPPSTTRSPTVVGGDPANQPAQPDPGPESKMPDTERVPETEPVPGRTPGGYLSEDEEPSITNSGEPAIDVQPQQSAPDSSDVPTQPRPRDNPPETLRSGEDKTPGDEPQPSDPGGGPVSIDVPNPFRGPSSGPMGARAAATPFSTLLGPAGLPGDITYNLTTSAAPYIFGDKGSHMEDQAPAETFDYDEAERKRKESWAYKINKWLE